MKVLVDTCVWSLALRRTKPDKKIEDKLTQIIADNRVAIIGPIRQEILSGISTLAQFNFLNKHLSSFKDISLSSDHFVKAAQFSNLCRSKDIQGSSTDFLVCAVAVSENLEIFTTDLDFQQYKKYLPIDLLS